MSNNELKLEEVVYYSHCYYCMNLFDEAERDPKYLSCHHTFCVKCLKVFIYTLFYIFHRIILKTFKNDM